MSGKSWKVGERWGAKQTARDGWTVTGSLVRVCVSAGDRVATEEVANKLAKHVLELAKLLKHPLEFAIRILV